MYIAVVQDLICSQDDAPLTHESLFYVAPPIVVHFNYVQFAAEYLL